MDNTILKKAKWCFVLHVQEDNVKAIENDWEMVQLRTGWCLEHALNHKKPPALYIGHDNMGEQVSTWKLLTLTAQH